MAPAASSVTSMLSKYDDFLQFFPGRLVHSIIRLPLSWLCSFVDTVLKKCLRAKIRYRFRMIRVIVCNQNSDPTRAHFLHTQKSPRHNESQPGK